MKKRVLGTILAAALIVSQAVTVLAAGSVSGQVALPEEYQGAYEVTEASPESFADVQEAAPEVYEEIMAVNEEISAGTADLQTVIERLAPEQAEELAAEVADKELVTPFFDLKPINGGILTEDGRYRVILSVPILTQFMRDVKLLHYSVVRGIWEIIDPENVDYTNRRIEAIFEDLSPVAVIANTEAAEDAETVAGSAEGTAPKTGANYGWAMWLGAAVVLGAAGTVTWRKARKTK